MSDSTQSSTSRRSDSYSSNSSLSMATRVEKETCDGNLHSSDLMSGSSRSTVMVVCLGCCCLGGLFGTVSVDVEAIDVDGAAIVVDGAAIDVDGATMLSMGRRFGVLSTDGLKIVLVLFLSGDVGVDARSAFMDRKSLDV